MAVTALGRGFSFAVAEPIRAAWEVAPQALITTASVYMVAQFGTSHHILPEWVAYPMAAGFEWTWLRGIATASRVKHGEGWIKLLTGTALITVVAYGILYILGLPAIGVIPDQPGPRWGVVLAVAKVVPIALMGYAAANLHRIHRQEVQAEADAEAKRERERQEKLQAARDQIDIERQRRLAELDMWKIAQQAKREVHQPRPRQFTPPPPQRKKPVIIDGIEYESRAAAAAALGITPQAVSKRARKANE